MPVTNPEINEYITTLYCIIAKNLKDTRISKGYSVKALARAAGISHPVILDIEKQSGKSPQVNTLAALAYSLGISISDLFKQ